jgi:outer membrane receptor protein involved in Fe transport
MCFLSCSIYANDKYSEQDFFKMSLEELSNIKVTSPATLTKLSPAEQPASVTVITQEDIANTPARNIYDLIETYVPGAMWMNYEEGPLLAMRGSIANHNYKYLLLLNNRLMNNKGTFGAKSELEQWDMNDIQRIEVVRGPGSVTYGAGAVAGVINIITHDAQSAPGTHFSTNYVSEYDSIGANLHYGHKGKGYDMFMYGGVTRTNGDNARHFIADNNANAGFIGETISLNERPLDYFADYQDAPQLKFHMEMNFLDKWNLWLRYTQQGSTWKGNEIKSIFSGESVNQAGLRDRQWTTTLEFNDDLTDDISLKAMISADSFDAERRVDSEDNPDPDSPQNFKSNFSETELLFRALVNWQAKDWVEIAFGTEYSRDHFGAGWGDDDEDMILGEDGVIVSAPNSRAIGPRLSVADAFFAGNGWETDTYSFFGEANLALSSKYKLLLSARADKNTFTDWLLSPRLALISKLTDEHILKLIVQRSQRMNTAGQLFVEDSQGIESDPETLDSAELAYEGRLFNKAKLKLATFINDADVIGWDNDVDQAVHVGDLHLFGIETEFEYTWDKATLGFNYSYVKQIDWELAPGLSASSVSYSDYNQTLTGTAAVMQGVGDDLNNWANQAFKMFGRWKIFYKTTAHLDAHVLWDYQGAKDGLESLRLAVQGQPEQTAVEQALAVANGQNVYDLDFRLNASVQFEPQDNFKIRMFVQNLLGHGDNKRYSFDEGNDRASPKRVRFTEEPRTFGIKIAYKF